MFGRIDAGILLRALIGRHKGLGMSAMQPYYRGRHAERLPLLPFEDVDTSIPEAFNDSLYGVSRGHELELESCPPRCNNHKPKMEALASGFTLAGTGIQATKAAKECYQDFRDSKNQISYALNHDKQLRLIQEQIDQLSPAVKERIGPAHASLHDIGAALPSVPHLTRKRDRLKWVISRKKEFEKGISQNNQIESSATLSLLISLSQEV